MTETIKQLIQASIDVKQQLRDDEPLRATIQAVTKKVIDVFRAGGSVFFCGNGGSAADAQHLAAEFSGRFYSDRDPLPSEALHCNSSYLTAVANDYGYDKIYSRLLKGIAKRGDVLIGLSTSGNSANIAAAFEQAKKMGVHTVGMTGAAGGRLKSLSDYLINIPSDDTPRIQESHITVGHIICQLTEEALFQETRK